MRPRIDGSLESRRASGAGLPRLLLIPEVAQVLRLSKAAVYQLIKNGQLRAVRFRGRPGRQEPGAGPTERWTYRVDETDLKDFIVATQTPNGFPR